ncbi:DmsC/YnfH family molybdoenzyme membrane anchor subunit [Acidicapsa dinghuensis]|uniref:DmsC/YnfH family molybdoenzyme membrane anchor subunit n=1 Tax=Acidicapsa dinghuensis TaxID=2218256 RepID=A0ABW1EMN9_9BACT|nr:DmsC/YnfH family molybdoenzyme membrane anchor subunit [Acidicapsa dinghuensis]
MPRTPGHGEQYRFHFDMTKCIGCKCCVVACNEQNGNPADILWRRVGEIEGGVYPQTRRHYLSMGCNHCLEPTCMTGCPVEAYTKDGLTGIVRHSADACIGCQYCTWNCSYGVPQYNAERGVVGKCDMCYGRLTRGQEPACAAACPEDAIRIEIVKVAEWREHYRGPANSPGMPSADDSISTTRITLPAKLPADVSKVDLNQLHPEHAHWPLIVMTVLTQLSVGAFTAICCLQVFAAQSHRTAALVALLMAMLALTASTLHLGRPIHAMRALKMWRRSWLSREVLLFTLFALAATAYSATLWFGVRGTSWLGALTAVLGMCGVAVSARLYLVPGRPAWKSPLTVAEFGSTTVLLGACGADILTRGAEDARYAVFWGFILALMTIGLKLARLGRSKVHELHGSWQLLTGVFSNHLLIRIALACTGTALLPLAATTWIRITIALLMVSSEFIGRYLFFVTVVPTNMASEYLAQEAA